MRFSEQKIKGSFVYKTVDDEVFGSLTMKNPVRLEGDMLDQLTSHIIGLKENKGEVQVKDKKGALLHRVQYKIERKPDWGEGETVTINIKQ